MNRLISLTALILFVSSPAVAEEYAIIKDTIFGASKIDIYKTKDEALRSYSGEGRIYRITREEIFVKRKETRKKVEVTEHVWVEEEKRPETPAKAPAQGSKGSKKP